MKLNENDKLKNIQLPYEKCIKYGAFTLSNVELIAVVLRCGTSKTNVLDLSQNLLDRFCPDNKLGLLYNVSIEELTQIAGIGTVKAAQIMCMFELAKRITKEPFSSLTRFDCPENAAGYFMQEMRLLDREHVFLLLLDSKNSLIKKITLSSGSVTSSVLQPREVFLYALRYNAVNVMLMHNHPSGNPAPSSNDISVTQRVKEAGEVIGINLIDHIIIGDNTYISLREKGFI